jgi:hypothetical protein
VQNYFTQFFFGQQISRSCASLILATAMAVLAGCGSGQAIPTVPLSTATPSSGPVAATIQLLASSTQMASSGATTVDLTAIVLDATKQAISGKTVVFSTGAVTETAYVDNFSASGVSDSNGKVTAKLNLGSNKANRTITISATADSAIGTNSVDVTGTTITISGSSSLAFNASTTLTFSVKDSAGAPVQGVTVSVTSKNANTIVLTPAAGATNSSGQVTALVTATTAGNDVITATAAGASATQALTISSATFAFAAPAVLTEIPLSGAASTPTVTANWADVLSSPVGKTVTFSTSRGTIAGGTVSANSSALTAAGTASVTVSSTTAGPAIITASGPGGTPAATLDVIFVATTASSAALQSIPGTVQVTTGSASQTNNSATITVQVRDLANNLVKNAGVTFNLNDPSGGRVTSSSGITDVSGSASVTYIAGSTSSAQNGVKITATVTDIKGVAIAPVVATTNLTVAGQSLLVRLGTDNRVGGIAPLNTKTYVAVVTDAAGNPSVGTTVQFALRPGRYRKGTYNADLLNNVWVQAVSATCPNEDLNFNGILDAGEGLVAWPAGITPALLPGAVATVNATAVTDASGIATATITYAKSQSNWVEVTLEARTSVTSNDPPTQATFFLPGLAADYTDLSVNPPGRPSPYGINASCADTL